MNTNRTKIISGPKRHGKALLIVLALLYLPIIVFYGHQLIFFKFHIHRELLIPTILDKYVPYDRTENDYYNNVDTICKVPKLSLFTPEIENVFMKEYPNPESYNCEDKMPLLFKTEGSFLIPQEDSNKFELTNCCYKSFKRGESDNDLVK